jgi:hypothetical protein
LVNSSPARQVARQTVLAAILALTLASLAAACGDSDSVRPLPTPGPGGEPVIRLEMRQSFFSPSSLTIRTNRKYLVELDNRADVANNLRIAGPDGEFDTEDDIVSPLVEPGETANLELLFDQPSLYDFRSDPQAVTLRGTLTVWEAPTVVIPTVTPSPTATPPPEPEETPAETPSPEGTDTPTETPSPEAAETPAETPTAMPAETEAP